MNNDTFIMNNYAKVINKLYAISHISYTLISKDTGEVLTRPFQNDTPYFMHRYHYILDSYAAKKMPPYMPYMIDVGEHISSALLKLDEEYYLFLGPVLSKEMDYQDFYSLHSDFLPVTEIRKLYETISQSPLMNVYHFSNLLSVCVDLFFHEHVEYSEILLFNLGHNRDKYKVDLNSKSEEPESYSINRNRILELEYRAQNAIRNGDLDSLKEAFHHPARLHAKDLGLTEKEYNLIFLTSFGTLMSRTAILAGIPAVEALTILDSYIKTVMSISDADEMFTLLIQLSTDYCMMVHEEKNLPHHSHIIKQCSKYISRNINQKITENDLARICNVSARTISRHFKEYLDQSVSEYITEQKLKEAAHRLIATNNTILDISSELQFSSQGYFTTLFKKQYALTPQSFRNKHRSTGH